MTLPADTLVPVTPHLRLEPIVTSICLCWQAVCPIQKALAAGGLHPSPKTACQGACFLLSCPASVQTALLGLCGELSHNQALVPANTSHCETCHQSLSWVRHHLWCGVHSRCNQITFSH